MNIRDTKLAKKYDGCLSAGCNLSWYALRTRSNYEKISAGFLEARGFEQFLPLCWPAKYWDRSPERSIPLFPGYVFCKFDSRYRTPILSSLGVNGIIACIIPPVIPKFRYADSIGIYAYGPCFVNRADMRGVVKAGTVYPCMTEKRREFTPLTESWE